MKKSKKLLCLLLTFLLVLTSISFSPAKVKAESDDYTDDYVFGEKDFFSASDTPNDKDMTFTATEDGLYSIRIKTIEGFNNLSVAKDADGNEIKPYARDYRIGDRTRIDYYQLKKGQVTMAIMYLMPESDIFRMKTMTNWIIQTFLMFI